jgi:hypothetical protein
MRILLYIHIFYIIISFIYLNKKINYLFLIFDSIRF